MRSFHTAVSALTPGGRIQVLREVTHFVGQLDDSNHATQTQDSLGLSHDLQSHTTTKLKSTNISSKYTSKYNQRYTRHEHTHPWSQTCKCTNVEAQLSMHIGNLKYRNRHHCAIQEESSLARFAHDCVERWPYFIHHEKFENFTVFAMVYVCIYVSPDAHKCNRHCDFPFQLCGETRPGIHGRPPYPSHHIPSPYVVECWHSHIYEPFP